MAEQRVALDPQDFTITRMSEHDLLEIVEIEQQSGLSRWGWAAYHAELQGANRDLMLIARPTTGSIDDSGPIAGYIVARETAGELHINNVAAISLPMSAIEFSIQSVNEVCMMSVRKCSIGVIR